MRRNRSLAATVAVAALLLLLGCEEVPDSTAAPADGYRFTMIIYGSPGNAFWTKVVAGANEAAAKLDCSVDVQFAGGDVAKENDLIETAIANKVDGIGMVINYDDAYDANVARAIEQGIGVVAFNIDDTLRAKGNARMAYIGQDMEDAGAIIAARLVDEAGLKAGDFVLCPVETPDAVYAIQRYAGVRSVLEAHGILSEVLPTGTVSLEDTLNRMTQYLIGHQEADAICAMGQMPMEAAPQAAEDAGLEIPNAGFDISRQIARNIESGRSIATVDQQPFYQGFFTVAQLYYYRKYGLHPCDINTGGKMVDKDNVGFVLDLADTVR